MPYNYNVDRFDIGLPLLSILILTSCVLVTVSLLPLPAALAQKKSTEVNAFIEKGKALANLDNYTGAINYYDKVLAITPNYVTVLNNKGNALDDSGNHTGAIQYYDRAKLSSGIQLCSMKDVSYAA